MPGRRLGAIPRNPKVVIVEALAVQILFVVILVGIHYWLHTVVPLNRLKPLKGHTAHFVVLALHSPLADFEVEHRRKIAFFKRSVLYKKLNLLINRRVDAQKVIGAPDYACPFGAFKITPEIRVFDCDALGRLYKREQHRLNILGAFSRSYHPAVGTRFERKPCPVYVFLILGGVYAITSLAHLEPTPSRRL